MSGESETKKHEASASKLEKQRKKGTVANAPDLLAFSSVIFTVITFAFVLPRLTAGSAYFFYDIPSAFAEDLTMIREVWLSKLFDLIVLLLAVFLAPALGVFTIGVLQNKGLFFALNPIAPDPNRLNPMAGIKRIFGKQGLSDMAIQLVRISIWGLTFVLLVRFVWSSVFASEFCRLKCLVETSYQAMVFAIAVLVVLFVIFAIVDIIVKRRLFLDQQKMTDTEVKRESKDNYGSPEIRSERKRINQEDRASPSSSVPRGAMSIFVHSGNESVAIYFDKIKAPLPRVTFASNDKDRTYAKFREAAELGIPTASSKFIVDYTVHLSFGQPIPSETFEEVAILLSQAKLL